ncbi:cadherin repeat domain-containing protein [Colwellia sp. 20A7]|uniref:cadherin repeat domain-containing protein n=1 Tax=Colwellia sp. 20A7 TaxID=2689569 RepID=UPI00135B174D|nr:cadherin repeat domain-containing protein [Colwellia sp. 20A7]
MSIIYTKKTLSLSLLISASILSGCNSSNDDNSAPVLTGDSAPVVAENSLIVGQYSATDADNDDITFSISGQDNALFTIDQNGQLTFNTAPDFDSGETGPYTLTVIATDSGQLTDELSVSIIIGDIKDTPSLAVVQTIAPDYSNSEVVYMNGATQEVNSGYYIKDASDYTLATYKTDVFHIGRFFIDTITKYNGAEVNERDTALWSFSTQDSQDSISRNPYALVSLDEAKAYLLRYGSSKVWIVNPQADNIDDFKTGELDLTSYVPENNTNGTPSPAAAVINDGKLYIVMQRLSDAYAPNTSYVAVFDTNTDEEIETNANSEDTVKGIPLEGLNPLENSITTGNDKVYISTRSDYSNTDLALSRIEEITPSDYSVRQVLNAGDITDNVSGFIKSAVIVSSEKGYFYTSESVFVPSFHEISSLYQFNPTTGEITESNVANTGTEGINFLGLDSANFLWLSMPTPSAPGVDIINSETNEIVNERLATNLNPSTIRFLEE